jgi:signal transduction histidine kinase
MNRLFPFVMLWLSTLPFAEGQVFNEPRQIQSLLAKVNEELPIAQRIEALNQLSYSYSQAFKADSGILWAEKAMFLSEKSNLPNGIAQSRYSLGYAMQNLGIHSEAVREFEEGLAMAERAGDKPLSGWLQYGIGQSYYMMRLFDQALSYQRNTLSYAEKHDLKELTPLVYNSIGNVFMWQRQTDSALFYFQKALHFASVDQSEFMAVVSYKNVGRAYLLKGNQPLGYEALLRSIAVAKNSASEHTQTTLTQSYECLALDALKHKDYDRCIDYAKKSLQVGERFQTLEAIYDAADVLYRAQKAKGNAAEALRYLELNQKTHEAMYKRLEAINQQALENRLQVVRHKADISLLSERSIRREQQNYWLIGGLSLSLLAGIWLFGLYRVVGKQKEVIKANNLALQQKVIERTDELELAYNEVENAVTKGQTFERKRIAADMHDQLGGLLSSASIGLESIQGEGITDREKKILVGIKRQIHEAYDEVRLLSHNLRLDTLEKEGLKAALSRMIHRISSLHQIVIVQHFSYTSFLPERLELHLYFIVMELLNNIVKHASASHVEVLLKEPQEGLLQLRVRDNGRGFEAEPSREKNGGVGLLNIGERLAQINGTLTLRSVAGETLVAIDVPIGDRMGKLTHGHD